MRSESRAARFCSGTEKATSYYVHNDAFLAKMALLVVILLSALVVHTGWHWLIERGEQLAKFPFPKLDAAFLASAMRGLMAGLILVGAVSLANGLLKRWIQAAGTKT